MLLFREIRFAVAGSGTEREPNMFTSTSRLLTRLASTRFPRTPVQRSPFSRCCHLNGNEQQRGQGGHPTATPQPPTRTETESKESSRDTFGTLSSSLANRNLQRRLDNEWFQDDNDDEDEFREKIEDTLRPRCVWTSCGRATHNPKTNSVLYSDRQTTSAR